MNTSQHTGEPASNQSPVGYLHAFGADEAVRLASCTCNVDIGGRQAIVALRQEFRNVGADVMEVSYAIPAGPALGCLLDIKAMLGGEEIKLKAATDDEAERIYEQASKDGDLPVMARDLGDDVMGLHLGKLGPGETATVEISYIAPIKIVDGNGTVRIPTVLGPRYGSVRDAERGAAMGDPSMLAEHPLDLKVTLWGEMRGVNIHSPSHPLKGKKTDSRIATAFVNERKSYKDRDIVLELEGIGSAGSSILVGKDRVKGGHVAILDLHDAGKQRKKRRCIHILADCSGSMAGDNIESARKFFSHFAESINDSTTVSATRFGSDYEMEFKDCEGEHARNAVRHLASSLDADMGGTEMERAVESVIAEHEDQEERPDILLLTDGLVSEGADLVRRLRAGQHRVFAIGLGSAPRASLLEQFAEATQGFALFAHPNQRNVLRDWARKVAEATGFAPQKIIEIDWDGIDPKWQTSLPQTVFSGVPAPVTAKFAEEFPGKAKVRLGSGETVEVELTRASQIDDELAKVVAHSRCIAEKDPEKRKRIALAYGLIGHGVALVGVLERHAKLLGNATPENIDPMVSAGHGGMGSVAELACDGPVHRSAPPPPRSDMGSVADRKGPARKPARKLCAKRKPAAKYSTRQMIDYARADGSADTPLLAERDAEHSARQITNSVREDGSDASLPRRCPKRFLMSGSTAHLSKLLEKVFENLLYAGWKERDLLASLKAVVDEILHRTSASEACTTKQRLLYGFWKHIVDPERLHEAGWKHRKSDLFPNPDRIRQFALYFKPDAGLDHQEAADVWKKWQTSL